MSALDRAKYLSFIDAGISNIWSLSLPGHLESLNLHGNYIRNISNLSHLTRLVHLDLSANQISAIEGLERLASLKTLNLSSNLITLAEGFSGLRSLERLNLSYNQIEDVTGLASFSHPSHRLQYLALHGNKLREVKYLVQSLKNVQTLRDLVLSKDGSSNPLCHVPGYLSELWSHLPQLHALNGTDKQGKLVEDVGDVSSIPGLESYLQFLLLGEKDQESEELNQPFLITPKIDAVIEQFKQKYSASLESSSSEVEKGQGERNTRRVAKEKNQISPVQQRRPRSRRTSKEEQTSEDDGGGPVKDTSYRKNRNKAVNVEGRRGTLSKPGSRTTGSRVDKSSSETSGTAHTTGSREGKRQVAVHKTRFADAEEMSSPAGREEVEGGDRLGREETEAFYKNLLNTLETERERRWKAEQATRRLADLLKGAQAKGQETESMKNSAMEATIQLKQAVMNEHESNQVLNNEIHKLQDEVRRLKESQEDAKRGEERSREALRAAEATLSGKEADSMADRMHQGKRLQEAQHKASAMSREVELLRHTLDATKIKLQQVQETLASREHQHREEVKNLYSLDSPELQKMLTEKFKSAERAFQSDLVKQQEKIEQLSKQYSELEDEFRYALRVEETRFREIKLELERESTENMENKQVLLAAQRKDESSTSMITELTSLVKEQKGRISELAKCKHEQMVAYKERIDSLEEALEAHRKQAGQLELVRQAKSKLQATVQAQESVIEGLKAERKLWGQELAQQGASLSQDRGRLEAKIEALNTEMLTLKKQLEREVDAVKIKTKMIDDQTETIRKLKEAVVEREDTIKVTREENLALQRSHEDQLAELKGALDDTRELLDRTTHRKAELKQQVADLQQELQETRDNHSSFSTRWKEKSELIGRLEQQVTQMKNIWTQKEAQMVSERDTALMQTKQAIDQLKTADSAFRQQLVVKEAAFQEQITHLEREKQQEVDLANQKVAIVEDEMRQLLRETEASKRAMENKLKKLNQTLGDLQSDLI